jgi:hypothetical protein
MVNQTPPADPTHDSTEDFELGRPPSVPRWVKAFGLAFLVLVLAIGILMIHGLVTGQGPFEHQSPIRH